MTGFRRIATVTALATLALIAHGAVVRATGSGLGCLDEWPTCFGGWVAPMEYHALIEWSHRALAGAVGVLVVATAVTARLAVPDPHRGVRRAAYLAVGGVVAQAALGRLVVTAELYPAYVSLHFLLAMGLVALTVGVAARARTIGRRPASGAERRLSGMVTGALGGTLVLLVLGALVRQQGAGLAFADWPLMGGRVLPAPDDLAQGLHFAHRLLALGVFGHLIVLALRARRDPRPGVRLLAVGVAGTFAAQMLVGGLNVWTGLAPAAVLVHVALSAVVWAGLCALAVVSRTAAAGASSPPPESPTPSPHPVGGLADHVRAYARLTKPRIIILLLVTTIPAMVLAADGMPPLWLIGATLLGGMMTAGSANAINQYLEREVDEKMHRTRSRPLPSHAMTPRRALAFGVGLGAVGTGWLVLTVNALAAALAGAAILFYVLVYTVWLKPSTPQNIVIGGAAGAAPVLVGWAAVTGTLSVEAWILFAIIFVWTPPHFWALAMKYKDDYARAGVPMLPVLRSPVETAAQILLYTAVLVAVTLILYPVAQMGPLYTATAVLLGGGFLYVALRLRWEPTPERAFGVFRYSLSYLALLFCAIAVDRLVPW